MVFVPPSHTLEALYYQKSDTRLLVSNSLAFLVERLGARPELDGAVRARFASAVLGIEASDPLLFRTDQGEVRRLLHNNLSWTPDGAICEQRKPSLAAPRAYDAYRSILLDEMGAVFSNADDASRTRSYSPVSTCSSGYDSVACLVLARELGCKRALSLGTARGGADDSGVAVADALGTRLQVFERIAHSSEASSEFVGSGMGGEDAIFLAFEAELANSVLLTGFHGDKIWSKDATPNRVFARGDVSGSSLGEFRLRVGFVHLPIPFIAAESHPEIAEISNSPAMANWSIGGWYDRPIPRRLAEEAGVPRSAFGIEKKAVSDLLFLSSDLGDLRNETPSEAEVALPVRGRALLRVRERVFAARLAAARLLDRAQKIKGPLRPVVRAFRRAVAPDSRVFEHQQPLALLRFANALSLVRRRYSAAARGGSEDGD
jgi:hypothetical protein